MADYDNTLPQYDIQYDIQRLDSNIFDKIETLIISCTVIFIIFYIIVLILSSNALLIFLRTSHRKPKQNLFILWDIIRLKNPVFR
jgi:hypothetical protein